MTPNFENNFLKKEFFFEPWAADYNSIEMEIRRRAYYDSIKDDPRVQQQLRKIILKYPSEPLDWQKIFLKMEIFEERDRNRIPYRTIYLPMPLGLMRHESSISYSFDEFNIAGEYGKDLANMLRDGGFGEPFRQLASSYSSLGNIGESGVNGIKGLGRAFNTLLEQSMQSTQLETIQALRAGAGYEYRFNYTKFFAQITAQRQFRADWRFYPKNREDADKIEFILAEIQRSSLPEISKMSFFDEFINSSYGTDESEPIKNLLSQDVIEKKSKEHKLYSSTLKVPREFKLSIYEFSNKDQFKKIENLVNFPIPFVVEDVMIQIGGEDSEADTFIRDERELNRDNYYNTSYLLSMGFKESTQFVSNDVEKLQTISE
jgi:hypothetical protein